MANSKNDTFLLFFHGLDSSNETSKYTCINHMPKFCQTVDYRNNFKDVFAVYDTLIQDNLKKYPKVVLAGHSLGGWFANHFADKYGLSALLIAPAISLDSLADRIPDVRDMDLSFPTSNINDMRVMIEVEDERLDVDIARRTLVNLPETWQVQYFADGHHRIARDKVINKHIDALCAS